METFIIVLAMLAIVVLGGWVVYRLNVLQGQRIAHFHGDHFLQGPYIPPPTPRRKGATRVGRRQGATRVGK